MWLFRKPPNLSRAQLRLVRAEDLTKISRLFRDGAYRYYGVSVSELESLLVAGYGAVLSVDEDLLGVVLIHWPAEQTCWLRGLALADGVGLQAALTLLLPFLHASLAQQHLDTIYYAGDEASDIWLIPALLALGYQQATEVVVYEKRDLHIPDLGHPAVHIRPAQSSDLEAVLHIDRLCFEPQWRKDDLILAPAIIQGPLFLIAELEGQAVGYAYATSHFVGRLLHLVRIAVEPGHQGAQIGVRLLASVVAYAAGQGATMITLNTQAYNEHAQRLYRWFGFAPTGERQTVLAYRLGQPGE
ncbi:GCN5-related N-acetyltransferase [Oscillochloris trichoides DG-6]|uniref:GCN5-related N-acetyltransferase n=1 Tax=Oscillochloris trichoides DG-6 TaxID=765420 RepID=E1IIP9_9CHLR|nr:GCN5-related N-acetyltransferase [Oscillochloris trichoides DG-6]